MPIPTTVSDAVRALNPHIFGTTPQVQRAISDAVAHENKKRVRQHEGDGMNKTERAFLEHLKVQYPADVHRPHALSFRLANGSNYRPDIISTILVQRRTDGNEPAIQMTAWETKGFMREAAAVRIKIAASLYPEIAFRLVTKRKGGEWDIQEILP